jgi:hypothetical protein
MPRKAIEMSGKITGCYKVFNETDDSVPKQGVE